MYFHRWKQFSARLLRTEAKQREGDGTMAMGAEHVNDYHKTLIAWTQRETETDAERQRHRDSEREKQRQRQRQRQA